MGHTHNIQSEQKFQSVDYSLTEKPVQAKAIYLQDNRPSTIIQKKANNTGLPDDLKSGIENLSGHAMDDVKVHYNSVKPAQLNAHAYAQGSDIHIASGQEKHLPHEAWHVVQQKQGRVKPTMQMKGKVNVNDDVELEKEADVMGELAQRKGNADNAPFAFRAITLPQSSFMPVQGVWNLTGLAANVTEQIQQLVTGAREKYILSAFRKFASGDPALADRIESVITSVLSNLVYTHAVNHMLFQSYGDGTPHTAAQLLPRIIALNPTSGSDSAPSVINVSHPTSSVKSTGTSAGSWGEHPDITYELITGAIDAVASLPEELSAIMETDKTGEYSKHMSPQDQLRECLKACKDKSPQQVAIYLYTTYFYGPLNKFLRGDDSVKQSHETILKLIDITFHALMRAFANTPVQGLLANFRMELKPSWMKGKEVGDQVKFPGLTSTHPGLKGVNAMWPDIESGAFGAPEKRLALLVFEGKERLIRPQGKYFRREIEDILPPGETATIVKKYETTWTNQHTKKIWIVDVYHLMILPQNQAPSKLEYRFGHDGYMRGAPGKSGGTSLGLGRQSVSGSATVKGSHGSAAYYNITRGQGVDQALEISVVDFLRTHHFPNNRRIALVSGKNWTCYIRCVLTRLGKLGSYDAIIRQVLAMGINLNSGVVVSSVLEAQIQAIIEVQTGVHYYVTATDVQDNHAASSNVNHGTQVELILTGAHFSLLE